MGRGQRKTVAPCRGSVSNFHSLPAAGGSSGVLADSDAYGSSTCWADFQKSGNSGAGPLTSGLRVPKRA